MKKRLSAAQIQELRDSGAKVTVAKKETPPPPPPPFDASAVDRALTEMSATVAHAKSMMAEHSLLMSADRQVMQTAFQFTVHRDRRGLMDSLDATPTGRYPVSSAKPASFEFTIKRDRRGLIASVNATPKV